MKIIPMLILALFSVNVLADEDQPAVGDEVAIAVQNQSIYPMPAFYASPTVPVSYGTLATVEEVSGDWLKVSTVAGGHGWIHRTAVTGALEWSGETTASGQVTTDEVMLAGRGFSEDIEEAYAGDHPELDFTKVDQIENSFRISAEDLYAFLLLGNLIDVEVTY